MKIAFFPIILLVMLIFFYRCKSISNEFTIIKQKKDTNCDGGKDKLPCENYILLKSKTFFGGYGTIIMDTVNEINRCRLKEERFYFVNIDNIFRAEKLLARNQKKKYYKYYRQYFGMINSANDTIISVTYLDFQNKRVSNKSLANWEYVNYADIVPCVDCDYPDIIVYLVNISKSTFICDK
jgi:hypothetical protein